ncbi:FACT complex subunit SSRP1-like [Corticium candelabrum]|uniref:FACT complex subunit SSRP1-like n=1 Tax=Corticium candelabrum TaxID=121492 RepID=UPI002E26287C|nr:FACT complex subunit SSRP1-like [Corticium candelabrum]
MSADVLEFSDVFVLSKGALNGGRLRLQKDKIAFKLNTTGKVEQIGADDVDACHWMKVAKGYELKVMLSSGTVYKFAGFKESDFERLSDFLSKSYAVSLKETVRSVNGWNWGTARFNGSLMSFEVDNKLAFEIPLSDVAQSTTGKNEVSLEFHQNDEAPVSLMEMRFFVPHSNDGEVDTVKEFHDNVVAKADILQATGESIVTFQEINLLTPRGRYSIKMYPTFMHLHGKTYDYKIPYTTVIRLFLLPHPDNRQMFFVIHLDPPIRQGQTRYHFLILTFNVEDDIEVDFSLTEEELKQRYDGKLEKQMDGPLFQVVSRVMKTVVGRKITIPGKFKGCHDHSAVACSHKTYPGFLYPLERCFIFVYKPPVYIRYDEVVSVNFARSVTTRTFDFEVEVQNGNIFIFSNIQKEEYAKLFDFVSMKKLHIRNKGKKEQQSMEGGALDMSDSDEEPDVYMTRVKAEAEERQDSDSDEDDDDFEAASSSDVGDLEYDSAASVHSKSSGESGDDEAKSKKPKLESSKPKPSIKVKSPVKTKPKPEKTRKTKSKDKDPTKPKKPMSVYMLWLNDNRQRIREDNPDAKVTDVAKIGGQLWKEVSDEDKKVYEEKASNLKKQYEADIEAWKAGGSSTEPKMKSKNPKKSSTSVATAKSSGGSFKSTEYVDSSDADYEADDD